MSNKYSRHQSIISRQSDSSDSEDHWLKEFQKSLKKDAVQPKSVDSSLFDQINSIMNGKSKYPSVAAAVKDMQERSGLTAYMDKIKLSNNLNSKKIASGNEKVELFNKRPEIRNTFENYIKDTKGNLSVPAIIEKVKSIHNNDVSDSKYWEDDNLIREISRLNLTAKKDNPDVYQDYSNLGVRDNDLLSDTGGADNDDAFHSLMPATK